ncbi:MAG TPA: redoxin domain-containing protein [Chitinophagaceae bacterium]|jgi:peroxiredoxin|nr:redoxin domain-containing protein [Chitinophagaceae bacterium]
MRFSVKLATSILTAFAFVSVYGQAEQMIGQPAPLFELKDTRGNVHSLDQLRGNYIVLHFAATWCPFCNAEAPNLEELYQKYRDKNVRVFIVDVREDAALVKKSLEHFQFSFPVLLDEDGTVSAKYAPDGVQPALNRYEVPIASNLIIDNDGKIRFYSLLNTASFDAKLTKLNQKLDELLNVAH